MTMINTNFACFNSQNMASIV